jgi:hypothetical protein
MRITEILCEKSVTSSWITDITYNRPNKIITMTLSNGRSFSIPGVTRAMFERWVKSPSKGQFFHDYIKGTYQVSRIR